MSNLKQFWMVPCGILAALMALLVVSCQNQSSSNSAAPSSAGQAPTTQPTAASAPLTATVVLQDDYKRLGFRFPPAAKTGERKDSDAVRMNRACIACHYQTDAHTMHVEATVQAACVDCHGGNWDVRAVPDHVPVSDPSYDRYKRLTHVYPSAYPDLFKTAANPQNLYMASMSEDVNYIRFINPGDLRAARAACAPCHEQETYNVKRSMMTHGAMLWGSALYNNGVVKRKNAIYGEEYTSDPSNPAIADPAKVNAPFPPTARDTMYKGLLPTLWPLTRWEVTIPGNVLRVFERGGEFRPIIGIPNPEEPPGQPDAKLSDRGYGTEVRTDPVFIGLQKTRLFDPTLNLFGTNDHPGDYRSSGCTSCHVVYANDRSPVHSPMIAEFGSGTWKFGELGDTWKYGNRGESFSIDPTVNPPRGAGAPTTQPYANPNDYSRAPRESGHPIKHVFVKEMPTSSCIVCHIHPGTNVLNSYLGFMWWDNETDGQYMYPGKQRNPSTEDRLRASEHNPEQAAARGLWSDLHPEETDHNGQVAGPDFLENVTKLNSRLTHAQFADFHGHGWVFRAVFKQDRHGTPLDFAGAPANPTTENLEKSVAYQWRKSGDHPPAGAPVHLKDIHLEKGMACVDCHFQQDVHGDGNLYGATRDAVMVDCADCHGTAEQVAKVLRYKDPNQRLKGEKTDDLLTGLFTGNAANTPALGADGKHRETPDEFKQRIQRRNTDLTRRFDVDDNGHLTQTSALNPNMKWTVVQTLDTTKPDSWWATDGATDKDGARRARFAHTVRTDSKTWGTVPTPGDESTKPTLALAHSNGRMSCYACHSSWNTSCFGCHLPQRANERKLMLHNEGAQTRNYTPYNYQTLRDDVYMLGVDSTTRNHRVVPIRSACAVLVSSQDANRQWIYTQQQTISAEGYAGTSFTSYFPHTVRATETKQCEDCHLSRKGDNNAIMAQLLLQGTKSVNFIGRFSWVAEGDEGFEAVVATEREEPQAVIGSHLHELAYPDDYKQHVARDGRLTEAHEHQGLTLDLQLRGEYLYAAAGPGGFIAYDIANVDNKGFSERVITAPVSPLGQRFYVRTSYATSVCSPSTLALDPSRKRLKANEEGKITEIGNPAKVIEESRPIHPIYKYVYVTDRDEGLVVIGNRDDNTFTGPGVVTLLDGDPTNNFLDRALAWNPGGVLSGARHMAFYGKYAYVTANAGLVIVDMDNPLQPRLVRVVRNLNHPRKVVFQFRYAFVVDADGLKVLRLDDPTNPQLVDEATIPLGDARDLYISRTYGYVAAGRQGLVIVDLEKPETPRVDQVFNAGQRMNDATAVRVGMTNASMFAYVADGRNGLKVLQLTSADDAPQMHYLGFSPRPQPRLIAWYPTHGPALALSEGLDRDRAVDESGNQLAVFGRRGARPFTLAEQQRLWLDSTTRQPFFVLNDPWTDPLQSAAPATAPAEAPQETPAPTPSKPRFPGRRPK